MDNYHSNKNAAETPEDLIFREAMADLHEDLASADAEFEAWVKNPNSPFEDKDRAASPRAVKSCVDNLKLRFPRR